MATSSGSVNLLHWLRELRHILLTETVYIKRFNSGARWKNAQGRVCGEGRGGSLLRAGHPLCHCHVVADLQAPFWVFRLASLHSRDGLNHQPLVIAQPPAPLWSLGVWGGTGNSNPLIAWLGPLSTSPHP